MSKCPCPICKKHSGRWKNQYRTEEPALCDDCYAVYQQDRRAQELNNNLNRACEQLLKSGFTAEQIDALNNWLDANGEK